MEIHTNPIIGLASNPNTSPATLAKLATHPDADVRYLTLINPTLPYPTMANLIQENDETVISTLVENPNLPDDLLIQAALNNNVETQIPLQIIGRKNVSLNVLENIWCEEMFQHASTMYALYEKTNLPTNIIEATYNDSVFGTIPEILNKLAEYSNTPAHIINNIITKVHLEVAFGNPLTFPHPTFLPPLTSIHKEHSRITQLLIITNLARNFHTDSETLTIISESTDQLVRLNIAKHHNTPKDVLFKLLLDADINVRTEAYYNPNCEEEYRQTVIFSGGIKEDADKENIYQTFKGNF